MNTKQCSCCRQDLPLSAFGHHKGHGPLELTSWCRNCRTSHRKPRKGSVRPSKPSRPRGRPYRPTRPRKALGNPAETVIVLLLKHTLLPLVEIARMSRRSVRTIATIAARNGLTKRPKYQRRTIYKMDSSYSATWKGYCKLLRSLARKRGITLETLDSALTSGASCTKRANEAHRKRYHRALRAGRPTPENSPSTNILRAKSALDREIERLSDQELSALVLFNVFAAALIASGVDVAAVLNEDKFNPG